MQAPETSIHRSRAPTIASVLLEIQSSLGMCLLQRAASDSSSSSSSSSSSDAKSDVEAALLAFEEGLTAVNGDPTVPHLQLVTNASLRVSSTSAACIACCTVTCLCTCLTECCQRQLVGDLQELRCNNTSLSTDTAN
jgi:hypothetical protein